MRLFKSKNKKLWFRKNTANNRRENVIDKPNQKVISYYTASRRQLDNFERTSNSSNENLVGKRHFNKLKQFWFIVVILGTSFVVIAYLGTLSASPHINITGTPYRSVTDYQTIVSKQFGSDIRNRLKPTLNSKLIESNILKNIAEVQEVKVKSSLLGHRAEVNLIMPKPLAVFYQKNGNNLILSERGRLLLNTSQSDTDNTTLPIVNNNTAIEAKAGEQFMRPDEAKALSDLSKQYKASGVNGVIYTITNIPHELQAKEPGRGYLVRYLLDDTIVKQYGALQAAQKELQKNSQVPGEYIDVRLVEKVYYR